MNGEALQPANRRSFKYKVPFVERVPRFSELPDETKNLVLRAGSLVPMVPSFSVSALHALGTTSEEDLFKGPLELFKRCFSDPLKDLFRSYHGLPPLREITHLSRTESEINVFRIHALFLRDSIASGSYITYRGALENTSCHFLGKVSKIRNKPVFHAADAHGRGLEYLDFALVDRQLSLLFSLLEGKDEPALYKAVIAYVMFIGAHPFLDGNGRVARLLANVVLMEAGLAGSSYLPIKEFFRISNGVVSIQTRRALFHGAWDGIVNSFCYMILISAKLRSMNYELSGIQSNL